MTSVLDPVVHQRLLEREDEIVSVSGIPKAMLHLSAKEFCSPDEVDWLKNFWRLHSHGLHGVYTSEAARVERRFHAMAAALLRNFIDARVMPVTDLLTEGGYTEANPTVLFVPNFYVAMAGKTLTSWQIQILHSFLLKRQAESKVTVLFVENLEKLRTDYGKAMHSHLLDYYHPFKQ